jgi:hypothetical protein
MMISITSVSRSVGVSPSCETTILKLILESINDKSKLSELDTYAGVSLVGSGHATVQWPESPQL